MRYSRWQSDKAGRIGGAGERHGEGALAHVGFLHERLLDCVVRIGRELFAAPFGDIEHEDAVEAAWTFERFGTPQRADGVVIARPPAILHALARKLVVFGVAFVFLRSINELDEIPDLGMRRRPQDGDSRAIFDRKAFGPRGRGRGSSGGRRSHRIACAGRPRSPRLGAFNHFRARRNRQRKGRVRRLGAKKVCVQGGTTLTYEAQPSNLLAHNQCFCLDAANC